MKYTFLGTCLLGGMLLVGCGAQPGASTVSWSTISSDAPPPASAGEHADYKLFASDGTTAIFTATLDKGDQYGFVKDTDGKIVAFAKDEKIPLTNKLATSYYWKEEGK
jgi:hypothetical protein